MYPVSLVKGTNSLLPLRWDKVSTLHMQVHTMNLNRKAIRALNLGQTLVDVFDCPVYDLTKEGQFRFLNTFRSVLRCRRIIY